MAEPAASGSPQALANEALRRAQAGDLAGAEPLFSRLTELAPREASAWAGLGRCRLGLGRPESALVALRRAADLTPNESAAVVNLAGVLARLGRHAEALATLDRATATHPEDAAIAFNRGRTLQALGRHAEALQAYDLALAIDPRLLPALSARATLQAEQGDLASAILDLDQLLVQRPGDRRARVRRAELALATGDWLGGLGEREARFEIAADADDWRPALPLWRGGEIAGRRLLLFSELREDGAAIADTLQMLRFARRMAESGFAMDIEVVPALLSWLRAHAGLPAGLRLIGRGEPSNADLAIAMQSLPLLCDAEPTRLPASLSLDPLARRAGPPRIIGLAPLASGSAAVRQRRDLPLAPLAGLAEQGVECLLLQPVASPPAWASSAGLPATPDVSRLAAALDTLDLVLAADNWIAHVAAARGLPVWLLLDSNADWTWLADRSTSPWYPSVRLYRQSRTGDWRAPVSAALNDLRHRA